jgi:hypothetical protein
MSTDIDAILHGIDRSASAYKPPKIGDKLHGFEVIRITPGGMLTWRCTHPRCVSTARLRPGAVDDWMIRH